MVDCTIAFVLCLKSKRVSSDWQRVTQLFSASIGSIVGQSNPSWRAVIVGHEKPDCEHLSDPRVEFVSVDFPPPAQRDYNLFTLDKAYKMILGLRLVKEYHPQFVMTVDADDLVSSRIVLCASKWLDSHGWIIRRGYRYSFGSRWISRTDHFNCGSNAIVSSRFIDFPRGANFEEDCRQCIILRAGHVNIESAMAELGHPLSVLPFRGAAYIIDHGDNITDVGPWGGKEPKRLRWLVRTIRTMQPLTSRIIKEFNLTPLLLRQR